MNYLAAVAGLVLFTVGAVIAWRSDTLAVRRFAPATPIRLTILVYVVLYLVGGVILAWTRPARAGGVVLIGAGMLAFGIGAFVASRLPGQGSAPGPLDPEADDGTVRPQLVAAMAAVGLASLAILVAEYGVPLLSDDPQAGRAGYGGLLFDVFRWLVPPAALVVLASSVGSGRPRMLVALAAVGAVAAIELLLASRALVFEVGLAAVLIAWRAGRRPRMAGWAVLGVLALAVFVGVQLARVAPDRGFSSFADAVNFSVARTVDRVLMIHPRTIDVAVRTIPRRDPYYMGSTYVRWLSNLTGLKEREALGYVLYRRLYPDNPGGFAAPGVLGEAWANGGLILSIGLLLVIGLGAQAAGQWIAALPSGPADQTVAALVTIAFARTYATSLLGFLLTIAAALAWWLIATDRLPAWRRRRSARSAPLTDRLARSGDEA